MDELVPVEGGDLLSLLHQQGGGAVLPCPLSGIFFSLIPM